MMSPSWSFAERSANDVEQEVTEVDQFDSETVDLRETLVRESAQNSQDARVGKAPVQLRIAIAQPDQDFLAELIDPLRDRLTASGFERPVGPAPRAIIVEDFGTTGLTGDVNDHNSTGNFRSFFFRHGGSYKTGAQNGRWGLGKLVFPMSSKARCFFGLTRRGGEDQSLLLGEAVLRTHSIKGRKYAPHGHFGHMRDGRILPVVEADFLGRFSESFGLERREEPGLSVVIPWPTKVPEPSQMVGLVARNYLWPILANSLVVDVMGTRLDAQSIRTLAGALPEGILDFADAVMSCDPSSLSQLSEPPRKPGGVLTHADELIGDEARSKLRQSFADGRLTGFAIPVPLGQKGKTVASQSSVRVFLRKAPENVAGAALYVRKDITVPDEARSFGKTDVFAALIADRGDVAEFLADAENPSHTKWSGQAQRLKANWSYPNQTLSFIRNAPIKLYQMLSTGIETEVRNALLDFFWVEDASAKGRAGLGKGSAAKGGSKPPPKPGSIPPKTPRSFRITQETGGFTVCGDAGLDCGALPRTLRLRLGYDLEGGNAVKEWDRFDFDLKRGDTAFVSEVTGADFEMDGNEIHLEIAEPSFAFTIKGFDRNRDLVVEASFVAGG